MASAGAAAGEFESVELNLVELPERPVVQASNLGCVKFQQTVNLPAVNATYAL